MNQAKKSLICGSVTIFLTAAGESICIQAQTSGSSFSANISIEDLKKLTNELLSSFQEFEEAITDATQPDGPSKVHLSDDGTLSITRQIPWGKSVKEFKWDIKLQPELSQQELLHALRDEVKSLRQRVEVLESEMSKLKGGPSSSGSSEGTSKKPEEKKVTEEFDLSKEVKRIKSLKSTAEMQTTSNKYGTMGMVFIQNDTKLAIGTQHGQIEIYEVGYSDCLETWKGHEGGVTHLHNLSDGRMLSASRDKTLKVWNIEVGFAEITLIGHNEQIAFFEELPNNQLLSTGGGKLILWDLKKKSDNLIREVYNYQYSLYGFAVIDKNRLFLETGQRFYVIEYSTGKKIKEVQSELQNNAGFMKFFPERKEIFIGSSGGPMVFMETENFTVTRNIYSVVTPHWRCFNDHFIVFAGFGDKSGEGNAIMFLSVETGTIVHYFVVDKERSVMIASFASAKNGNVAVLDMHSKLNLWTS